MNIDLVNPELAEALETFPELEIWKDIPAARALEADWLKQQPPVISAEIMTSDRSAEGPEGAPNVQVRIYQPARCTENLPALLWIHGGGYVTGSLETSDRFINDLLATIQCVVVSVDYRLAPEHPYPAPLEDCYAALLWLAEHADELRVNRSRIAIAGVSAGGGLAAGLALLARDRAEIDVMFQLLLCPMIDDRNTTPSSYAVTDSRVWNRDCNQRGWAAYLGRAADLANTSHYAAAARADELDQLPPAYVAVGSLDLFVDENIDYAQRLNQARVPAELHVFPGGYHCFEFLAPDARLSKSAIALHIDALARAFGRDD